MITLALKYRWEGLLKQFFEMYLVFEKNTDDVIYKTPFLLSGGEKVKVDYNGLFTDEPEENDGWGETALLKDICVRPLITSNRIRYLLIKAICKNQCKFVLKNLLDICEENKNISFTAAEGSRYGDILLGNKIVVQCLILFSKIICSTNDLELFQRILCLSVTYETDVDELKDFCAYLEEFSVLEYQDYFQFAIQRRSGNLLKQIVGGACMYYSLRYCRKGLIDILNARVPDSLDKQLMYEMSLFLRKGNYAKKLFWSVDRTPENFRGLTRMAYKTKNINIITYLLKNQLLSIDESDSSVLKTACKLGDYQTAKKLFDGYPGMVDVSSFLDAVDSGNVMVVKLFFDYGLDTKPITSSVIKNVCTKKNIEMLRFLLKNGVKINTRGENGIAEVLGGSNDEILKWLLSDAQKLEKNALDIHIWKSDEQEPCFNKILKFFIAHGLEIDAYVADKITLEVNLGDIEGIKRLLSKNFEKNYTGDKIEARSARKFIEIAKNSLKHKSRTCIDTDSSVCCKPIRTGDSDGFKDTFVDERVATETNFDMVEQRKMDRARTINQGNVVVLNDKHLEKIKARLLDKNFEILDLLVACGADINSHDFLVLRTAYKAGNIKWINHFIEKGARLGVGESNGLEEACKSDDVEVLRHWVAHGGSLRNKSRFNGIRIACELGNLEMVKVLMENGADFCSLFYNGVVEACRANNIELLRYLLKNNAEVKHPLFDGLQVACATGNIELVKLLIENGVNPVLMRENGVLEACEAGSLEITELLLKSGGEMHFDIGLCIYEACNKNNYGLVKLLLEKGGTLEPDSLNGGLFAAVRANNVDLVKLLLKNGAKLANCSYNYILEACVNNNLEMVRILCENDVLIVRGESSGVIEACRNDNFQILSYLLCRCPNLVLNTNYGIKEAYNNANVEVAKLLVKYGVDVKAHDSLLLKFAYKIKSSDLLELLLNRDLVCPKNFLKKLNRFVLKENRCLNAASNQRYLLAKYILDKLAHF